jgi:hypothetical protein
MAGTRIGDAVRGHGDCLAVLGNALVDRSDVRRPYPGLEALAS